MGAVVSPDGFMAGDDDDVGPLLDWLGNGDVAWRARLGARFGEKSTALDARSSSCLTRARTPR